MIYSYPDTLLEKWVDWSEGFLSKKLTTNTTDLNTILGTTGADNPSRAVEFYNIGCIDFPLTGSPLAYDNLREDKSIQSDFGYICYLISKAKGKFNNPKIEKAFNAICAVCLIQQFEEFANGTLSLNSILFYLMEKFPLPQNADEKHYLRFLTAAMFCELNTDKEKLYKAIVANATPTIKIIDRDTKAPRATFNSSSDIQKAIDDKVSLTGVVYEKGSTFFIGNPRDASPRGLFYNAYFQFRQFLSDCYETEMSDLKNNKFKPVFQRTAKTNIILLINSILKSSNKNIQYFQLMKSLQEGCLEATKLLEWKEEKAVSNFSTLNTILYGPPGTGKTHNAINHALAIVKGHDLAGMTRDEIKKEFDELVKNGQIQFVTFHQSYSYEEFVEGIKPTVNDKGDVEYNIKDGVFKKLCLEASRIEKYDFEEIFDDFVSEVKAAKSIALKTSVQKKDFSVHIDEDGNVYAKTINSTTGIKKEVIRNYMEKGTIPPWWGSYIRAVGDYLKTKYKKNIESIDNSKKRYVLIIDEINRGNISKIFGELITLIEDSKRIGEKEALKIKLTYSGSEGDEMFGVPSNLFLVGTMNSADRSIALIDTALRRRFTFIEHTSDTTLLSTDIDGIDLKELLTAMNSRIEFLLDKDHLLGHAYFMNVKTKEDLCSVFRNKVIPLLEEYFYGDYNKIQLVLGDNKEFGKLDENQIVIKRQATEQKKIFGVNEIEGFEEKYLYSINEKLVKEDFASIPTEFFTSIYPKAVKEA